MGGVIPSGELSNLFRLEISSTNFTSDKQVGCRQKAFGDISEEFYRSYLAVHWRPFQARKNLFSESLLSGHRLHTAWGLQIRIPKLNIIF